MPLNFPNSPALNEPYTFSDYTWKWNGFAWKVTSSTSVVSGAFTTDDYGFITTASDADYDYGALT